jgi:hypothetical protein
MFYFCGLFLGVLWEIGNFSLQMIGWSSQFAGQLSTNRRLKLLEWNLVNSITPSLTRDGNEGNGVQISNPVEPKGKLQAC